LEKETTCVEGKKMLNKSEERVKLLRKGFSQKQIEKLYIKENNFKIVNPTLLFELFEIEAGNIGHIPENVEAAVEYAQSLCAGVVNLCDISQFSGLLSNSKTI
jgi:hypothetical protein